MFDAVLEAGDVVIMGSDGIFDNLTDYEMLQEAFEKIHTHYGDKTDGEGGGIGNGGVSGWSNIPLRQTNSPTVSIIQKAKRESRMQSRTWKAL